uniref:Uncharacterized protein n=1 Tax=Arundo donax TaxID=35708 RepID=A0A0A9DNF4_ARUDO
MANFAAQLKDKFLGLVDRVAGRGGRGSAGGDKDVREAPTKLPEVQVLTQNCFDFYFGFLLWSFCMMIPK